MLTISIVEELEILPAKDLLVFSFPFSLSNLILFLTIYFRAVNKY